MDHTVQLSAVARRVPTYDSDGARIRDYSEARVRDLLAFGKMVVLENRSGRILFAQFVRVDRSYRRPASKPKYKLFRAETQLPGVEACSALFAVPLDLARSDLAFYQRAIFEQVLLSIQDSAIGQPKVVSISAHRRKAKSYELTANRLDLAA